MSIIHSFDDKTEAIVNPSEVNQKIEGFPKTVIMVFKERLINYMQEEYGMKIIGNINAGTFIPVYQLTYEGIELAVVRTLIGGVGTVGIIEELIVMGAEHILIYGTCGTLDKNILKGHFIIPTAAYRDEGVSYHYMKESDFVEVDTANELAKIFDQYKIPYIKGKTWTTDAIYRETRGNMEKRKQEGCIVVDMECASAMAVGRFRNIPIYQFLFGDDTLDSTKWDRRKLQEDEKEMMEKNIINIGFKVAYEIEIRKK